MTRIPRHIAIIMDGNGRWAEQRGKMRLAGHRAGAQTLENVLGWCIEAGVEVLTVYAFSTENWKRPAAEVTGLMKLLGYFIREKRAQLMRDNVRFRVIGRRDDLPTHLVKSIEKLECETAANSHQLVVALSYGGRAEIVDAAAHYAADVAAGKISDKADETIFARYLYAPDLPEPDLIIRTSGEERLSNFLLWQAAYAEFYFTKTLWPDFGKTDFDAALAAYAARDRRKGGHA